MLLIETNNQLCCIIKATRHFEVMASALSPPIHLECGDVKHCHTELQVRCFAHIATNFSNFKSMFRLLGAVISGFTQH